MRHSPVVLVALCCALLSGCQAARPLPSAKHPITNTGRQLLSVNWGAFTCAGMDNIGFSTSYKALAHDGVIMGNVRIHNRGNEPFLFNTPGFRLMGLGGYMDSQMKCPDSQVPAGGMLQCGFVASAVESLAFDSFRPFFVREASTTPCFCQQPYTIDSFALPAEANFAMSLNDNDIDDDDHDDNDDDDDDKKIVRINHDDGVHGTSVHVNLSEDLNNLVKPWLGFADAVAEAFGDSAKALSQALSKTVPDALSLADEVANSIFSVRVGPIGFITEDPRQPLQTIPRAHSVTAPKQPAQPTPKAVDSVTSVAAPKVDSVTAPKTDSAVAPSSPQGPSTGTDSKVSTPSDKADASATPAKEAPQAAKDTPILTEPVASKAPVVEAPVVADKKETVVTAPTTPSKPVDAVSTPTDAPVVTRPAPPTTPTPTSDKQEVKDSKTQTPAVDVPKPAADNKDQKALPVAETPATQQAPTAVTPAPKAEDKPAEVITPKGPVDAPKSSEPAVTTPVSKPATEAKKDSAPSEKPAVAAPLPTEADKTTTGPAITPKPAADSNKQDSTPVEKPAVVPTPAKTPIDKPATVTPTDAPKSTGLAVDKAADSAPKTAGKPVAEKPAGEAVKPSEADKVADKPVRSAYRVASIY